jgi:hypothetical protein
MEWVKPAVNDWQKLVSLRLFDIFYSLLAILFCYLLAKEIIKNRWWQLLVVFLLTNTLMYVFLSGGVSYDNITNLCSFAGIYFLIRVFNYKSFYKNSLGWLLCICIGTLVKITELPLALIMGLAWILFIVLYRRKINFRPNWDWKLIVLIIISIGIISLNLSIWGVNLVKYGHLEPACGQVLTKAQCNKSPFVAQAKQLNLPTPLTYKDIIKGAGQDPVRYVLDYSMVWRIFGIMGHRAYQPPPVVLTLCRILLFWMILITIRVWKKPSYAIGSLFVIFIFYIIVVFYTSYHGELVTGFKHEGIQGRYIFPVIGIIYTLMVYYISIIPNTVVRRLTLGFVLLLFLYDNPVLVLFLTNHPILPTWLHPTLKGWFS